MENNGMTPSRPYIFRAIYQWLCDNGVTPYMAVNAEIEGTIVPLDLVKDGQIVLNLAPHAIGYINIENHGVSFSARFNGVSKELYAPMPAIQALYAKENGQGMVFPPEDFSEDLAAIDETPLVEEVPLKSNNSSQPSLRSIDSARTLDSSDEQQQEPAHAESAKNTSENQRAKSDQTDSVVSDKKSNNKDTDKKDRSHLKVIK
jgi:stringent starvation protein B